MDYKKGGGMDLVNMDLELLDWTIFQGKHCYNASTKFFDKVEGDTNLQLAGTIPKSTLFFLDKISIFAPVAFLVRANARLTFQYGAKEYISTLLSHCLKKDFGAVIQLTQSIIIRPGIPFHCVLIFDYNKIDRKYVSICLMGEKLRLK